MLVSLLVLLESEWVLRSRYGFNREALLSIFRALLETRELTFEDEPALEEALFRGQDGACVFSDCLITAHNRQMGCRATAAFNGKSARLPGTVSVQWKGDVCRQMLIVADVPWSRWRMSTNAQSGYRESQFKVLHTERLSGRQFDDS